MLTALPEKSAPYVPESQLDVKPETKRARLFFKPIDALEFIGFMALMEGGDDPLLDMEMQKHLNSLDSAFRETIIEELRGKHAQDIGHAIMGEEGLTWLRRCLVGWENIVDDDGKQIPFVPVGDDGLCPMVNINRMPPWLRNEAIRAIVRMNKLGVPEKNVSESPSTP